MKRGKDKVLGFPKTAFRSVDAALREDIGTRDATTELTIPRNICAYAKFVFREEAIVSGIPIAEYAFKKLDKKAKVISAVRDGSKISPGESALTVYATCRAILTAERVSLNFISRLSGIATATDRLVEKIAGTNAMVLDTRKTIPLHRELEKYGVRCGGGFNHRMRLDSAVMIKDNHIAAAGTAGVRKAILEAKKKGLLVEIEIQSEAQLEQFIESPVDIIMLDNLKGDRLRAMVQAIRKRKPNCIIEASGGVTLDNIREIAEAGVDWISTGSITHSVRGIDVSLDIEHK